MVSNVGYYVAGFDAAGKRVGSLIFEGKLSDNKDVAAAIEKGKAAFEGAAVVEVISADDYSLYLSGAYVRGENGKPVKYVAPEPTETEKKAVQQAELTADYKAQVAELTTALQVADLNGDADAKASIQSDFKDLQASYKEGMEALK
ncbi:hypothetical protein [uncultured Acidaminococcus sp.]|uniref:hypothetical protein n=1 Tax=uncultured Acidaminococcus sp. TaxID=352152 RepID=UPI002666BD12|nr:hypothetical protein [uncultured Acidaminococcus sp.]